MNWRDWDPASYPADILIGDMLAAMPQSPIKEMPAAITLLENPSSPFYLPGPAGLEIHDVLHCVLRRGLLSQDEAFVIGFTMGAASGANTGDRILFKRLSSALYPRPFDFCSEEFDVYDIAFDLGQQNSMRDLHLLEPKALMRLTWSEACVRTELDKRSLLFAMEDEIELNISGKASERLRTTRETLFEQISVS